MVMTGCCKDEMVEKRDGNRWGGYERFLFSRIRGRDGCCMSLTFGIKKTGDVWLSSRQVAAAHHHQGFHWPNTCHRSLSWVLNCWRNLAKIGIFSSLEATCKKNN